MRIKLEHLLIAIIVLIGLYLLMNRCRCNGFSVGGIEGEYDTCKEYWEEEVACDDENLIHDESKANYNLDKSDVWDYDEECCQFMIPYVDLTKVIVEGDNLKYINADNTKTVLYVGSNSHVILINFLISILIFSLQSVQFVYNNNSVSLISLSNEYSLF